MKNHLLELLEKNGQTSDISLGFHIPPFNSVKHLHLHGISPKDEMGFHYVIFFIFLGNFDLPYKISN